MKRSRVAGFTLLEVMVAVALLSLTLVAIFSGQGMAIKTAQRAQKTSTATLLARCKMGELEEFVATEGMPAIEASESDECCEGGEQEGFRCEWKIERIELPEMGESDEEGAPSALDSTRDPGDTAAPTSPADQVNSLLAGEGDGEGDMMAELALSYAYPVLKTSLEEQTRRAVVTVHWTEGRREQSFTVYQYLVAEPAPTTNPPQDE